MKLKWLSLLCSIGIYLLYPSITQAAIRVGVMLFDPPMVISATQGFHVDLANKLCEGLHEQCIIKPMEWDKLFVALDKKEIDLQMGVFITLKRAKHYLFSIPYMPSNGRFITLTENNITSLDQLKGQKVGTLQEEDSSGIFRSYIRANHLDSFKMVDYEDLESLLNSLVKGSTKAALAHSTSVDYWVANSSGNFSPVGPAFPLGNGYSIMALPENKELIDNINVQIQKIKANGDYEKIYNTYFNSGDKWK